MSAWEQIRAKLLPGNKESILPPTVKLPVLPKALIDFQQAARDPDVEFGELEKILSTDSGLSSTLLRHVNSGCNATRVEITSVRQALSTLGLRNTLLHLTTSGMQQAMKSTASKLINFQNFWNYNLERAICARQLAGMLNANADLAFTAAMLQDFLLPLISNELYDDYLEFTRNREQYGDLPSFERSRQGWDHAEAAAQVMVAWNFPDELVCCVCLHHRGLALLEDPFFAKSAAAAVAIASLLPDPLQQELNGIERLADLEQKIDGFEVLQVATAVDAEFSESGGDQLHYSFLKACHKALADRTA